MVRGRLYAFILVTSLFLVSCSTKHSDSDVTSSRDVALTSAIQATLDSVLLTFNFYPERWSMTGDTLWVVNSRDSLSLIGYDIKSRRDFCHCGIIGNGPDEYVSPGIMEGDIEDGLVLYGNTENKVVNYSVCNDNIVPSKRGRMPEWISERGLPRPYTRIAAVNDSICVGTYFLPRQAGADIFNWYTGNLQSELNLSLKQPEEDMSGPYEFKIAASGDKIVVAYRYINRVEVFYLVNNHAILQCVLGDDINQNDLYEADRDDEMIKYYSDVQCDSTHIYLLYHGVEEKKLNVSSTYLRVYDINLTKNLQNLVFDKYYNQFLVNGEKALLYSPVDEDYLFTTSFK